MLIVKAKEPALSLSFNDPKAAIVQLDQLLADFASLSGYEKIATALLIPVPYSAAAPSGWGMAYYDFDRCIAFIPCKGWFSGARGNLPILHFFSEWAEVGRSNWGLTWAKNARGAVLKLCASQENFEIGESVE